MTMYHVVVTGSRPDKDPVTNRYLPMPEENIQFIKDILNQGRPDIRTLYNGMAAGVDTIAHNFAFLNRISEKQFPAYWKFDRKAAGHHRNEVMIDTAIRDADSNHNSEVVVLAFTNKPLELSKGTKACVDYAIRKNVSVRHFMLPILSSGTNSHEPFHG